MDKIKEKGAPPKQTSSHQEQTEKTLTENLTPFEPEPNYKKTIIIVFIIVILITATLLWWFFSGKNNQNKNSDKTIPKEKTETSITPSRKIGFGEEWELFISKYDYQFRYPAKWNLHQTNWQEDDKEYSLMDEDEAIIRFREPNEPTHNGEPYGITISLKKPLDNPDNLPIKNWLRINLPILGFISTSDITVSNIKSAKVKPLIGGNTYHIYIPYKDKVIKIVSHSYTTKDSKVMDYQNLYDYDQALEQILATWEFLGKNTCSNCPVYAPPSSNWCDEGRIVPGEDIYDKDKDCYCVGSSKCVK